MTTSIDPVKFLVESARTNFAAFVAAVHRPRYRHSAFSAAVCRAIDQFVDDLLAGKRPVLILKAPPQHGKQISCQVPVLTENRGWVQHGDLCVGDSLYRPDGTTTRVVAIGASMPSDMRVTFSDGTMIDTHARHEWLLHRAWVSGRSAQVFETQEIESRGVWKGEAGRRGSRANFQLPDVDCLQNASKTLPVAPYSLGVWLGDGNRVRGSITVSGADTAMFDAVEADGYPLTGKCRCNESDWHGSFAELTRALRKARILCENGMSDPKRIPDAYFTASIEQRLELLAGLIDSDGYVYPENGRVTFSNTEPLLVRDVARLVASFGWRVTTSWFEPHLTTSGIRGRARVAQVCFQPDRIIPCRLGRYRDAFRPGATKRKRAITKVERGDFGWGNCIQVEHPDGMYLIGDTFIPTHNSSLISRCLAPYLFGRLHGKIDGGAKVASISYAHTLAQRNRRDAHNIMLEPIYREIFPHTSLIDFKGIDNASDGLELPGGAWLKAGGIGGGLTGHSVHVGIIDDGVKNAQEALSVVTQERNRNWYDSVFVTRLQQISGQVIIGTPWSAQDILAHVTKVHADNPNRTLLSFPALNHEGEIGYNPDLPEGPLVPALHSEEKLREVKAHISEFWWAAMYQQTPLADFGAIYPRKHVQYYRRADLPKNFIDVVMSCDATFKDGSASDYVAVAVWGKTSDNRIWMLGKRRERLAFMATAQAIMDLKQRFPYLRRIFIEDAANGSALVDMLRKHFPQIEGVPPMGSKEARAHAVSWVWANELVMLPHPDEDPAIVTWVDEITSFPDTVTGHDDCADTMALALQQLCLRTPIAALITNEILRQA